MAAPSEATTGQKRGPGRPAKSAQPDVKKARLSSLASTPTPLASTTLSSATQSPAPEKQPHKLPVKIFETRSLPSLPEPQPASLPDSDYQSIAASAVLQASFDRSRLRWVQEGVFEKYWVKPESGKHAAKPPPGNPEVKWQKKQGPCRIRVEPHIFEAEVWTEERPIAKPAPPKQYSQMSQQVPYGQQQPRPQPGYNQQQQQNQFHQGRPMPPVKNNQGQANMLPSMQNMRPSPAISQPTQPRPQQPTPQPHGTPQPQQQDKKPSPDPVISMLANRASSDPVLKTLMKEVATGSATPEQLKVFQSHIDDLSKNVNEQKKIEEDQAAKAAQVGAQPQQPPSMPQYDRTTSTPSSQPQPYQQPAPAYQPQAQQQSYPAAAPPPPAQTPAQPQKRVILQFTSPGATEDRFLFPQHAILESLSKQHLLASFLVVRKGSQAADSTGLDPEKDYFQNVTLMVEVAYGRESTIRLIRDWVKPANEVRAHMEVIMARCERAPEAFLALRLPVKESVAAAEEAEGGAGTPVPVEEAGGRKANIKFVKKAPVAKAVKEEKAGESKKSGKETDVESGATPTAATGSAETPKADVKMADPPASSAEGETAAQDDSKTETGRPRRAVRKSVRISEV